jgi:hypothetical protein
MTPEQKNELRKNRNIPESVRLIFWNISILTDDELKELRKTANHEHKLRTQKVVD